MSLFPSPALGRAIPPDTPHSVVVSLPEWEDNVQLSRGNKIPSDLFETTYPRFGLHKFVKQLGNIIQSTFQYEDGINCLLFPSFKTAEACRLFANQQMPQSSSKVKVHHITEVSGTPLTHEIFALLFPEGQCRVVMKYWMFSGEGISSRFAKHCLIHLSGDDSQYAESKLGLPLSPDHAYYEYYQKHIPLSSVKDAKDAIRARYAGILPGGGNIRGVPGVSIDDVFLYSTGMTAIWNCHQLLGATITSRIGSNTLKNVHVNILYNDSYSFLGSATPGYHIFTNDSIDDLERFLKKEGSTRERPAILALFSDVPGNPHLRTADLPRLRALADLYHFPIILDETVGHYLNVQVLPFADIVVCSLTKIFSGFANVLGGALMLNPASPFYAEFKEHLIATYEDTYFDHDALVMEINSRKVEERVDATNRNAEALADMLYARSVASGVKNTIVKEVFYPKYQSRENYERCRNTAAVEAKFSGIGYGSLLSVSFTSLEAARVFHDSLQCYKGSSMGAIVTLATPYVALAFQGDGLMQWARDQDLDETLVRFAVGAEDKEKILNTVSQAIAVAEQWMKAKTEPTITPKNQSGWMLMRTKRAIISY